MLAEARMAAQYLERAENWAAEIDEEIVADMVLIHRRLIEKIDRLCGRTAAGDPPLRSQHRPVGRNDLLA
jgi:hypothetical protein